MGSGSSSADKAEVKWVESQGMQAEPGMEREDSPHPYNMYGLRQPPPMTPPPKTSSTVRSSQRPTSTALKDNCALCLTNPSESYCTDCGVQMCQPCVGHHEDANLLKKHRLITFEKYKLEKATIDQYVKSLICHVHAGNELTYYCSTCSIPICMVCAEYNHTKPQHQHKTLIAGKEKKKTELQEVLKESESRQRELTALRATVTDEQQSTVERGQVTASLVREHTEQLTYRLQQMIGQLQMHGQNLEKQVLQWQETNSRYLNDKKNEINRQLTKIDYEMEKTRNMVNSSNDIGFLLSVNKYIARLKLHNGRGIGLDALTEYDFVPNEVIIESMPINVVGKLDKANHEPEKGMKTFPGGSTPGGKQSHSRLESQTSRPNTTQFNGYAGTKASQMNGWSLNDEERKVLEAGLRPNTMASVASRERPSSKASGHGNSRASTRASSKSRPATGASNRGDAKPPVDRPTVEAW
ncbi:B-box type zinc finger protein ncl-1-like [Ptychodera flava]|uniref:B-box type zinc finger protein ncl-1-like n=1 Tax=Ptychodera flava TaxID=63121 RepID=UPI003969BCEF